MGPGHYEAKAESAFITDGASSGFALTISFNALVVLEISSR